MANRPSDFDITTPTGASSPRQGDDELRKIKQYTQNAYNDLTQASGAGVTHTNLFGTTITADTRFTGLLRGDVENTNGTTILDVSEARLIGSADRWDEERTITLSGDVTGSVALDGSADVTMTTTISNAQDSDVTFNGAVEFTEPVTLTGSVNLGGTLVTANGEELNILNGATVSTAELNVLDGATITTAELNVLDGVTATATELNKLAGVTATAAELNTLDGVTSTSTELNILDGATVTTAELNILEGVTATTSEVNKLDLADGTHLGILKVEAEGTDPVASDFTGNITIIGQY